MASESDDADARRASAQARRDEPAPRRGLARLLDPNLLVPILVGLHVVLCLVGLWSFGWFALSPDEMDHATVARNLVEGEGYRLDLIPTHPGVLPAVSHLPEWHGLLKPFELVPLFWLFGAHDRFVKLPAYGYLAGAILAAYAVAARIAGPYAGGLAALLLAASTEIVAYAAFGFDDVGSAFWSLLTLYFVLQVPGSSSSRPATFAGLSAALGVLEKFTQVLLPFAVVGAILMRRSSREAVRPSAYAWMIVPPVAAACMYLVRNYLVWGSFEFRFSALEWLGKHDMNRYWAYYPTRPSVGSVWAEIGVDGVLRGLERELRILWSMTVDGWPVMVGGPIALVAILRKQSLLALSAILFGAVLIGSVCMGHQFEPRYILALLSLNVVAIVLALAQAAPWLLSRFAPHHRARAGVAIGVLVWGLFVVWPSARFLPLLWSRSELAREGAAEDSCGAALAFVMVEVPPRSAVLTANPWMVLWDLRRPAVMAPTNGPDALEAVARHYRTEWALAGPYAGGGDVARDLKTLRERGSSLNPQLVAKSPACEVYTLTP
jgi:hypothetical protein